MHSTDKKLAWVDSSYQAIENLGEVRNRSMSIVGGQSISIKGTSGRRESIKGALLAGKMIKPVALSANAIIEEEEEEEEDHTEKASRRTSKSSVRENKYELNV